MRDRLRVAAHPTAASDTHAEEASPSAFEAFSARVASLVPVHQLWSGQKDGTPADAVLSDSARAAEVTTKKAADTEMGHLTGVEMDGS